MTRTRFGAWSTNLMVAGVACIAMSLLSAVAVHVMFAGTASGAQSAELITPTSVGPVRLAMTLDEVEDALPAGLVLSDRLEIVTGVDGYAVTDEGTILFFVATDDSGSGLGTVDLIVAVNRSYRTADGVGPGTPLSFAEGVYGSAALSVRLDDRGQEIVEFADGPADLMFLTSDAGGPRAGIYADDATETDQYTPTAVISSVWVDCRVRACPVPDPPPTNEGSADVAADEDAADEDAADDAADAAADGDEAEDDQAMADELPDTAVDSQDLAMIGLLLAGGGFGLLIPGRAARRARRVPS